MNVKYYINKLCNCKSIGELKMLKSTLPSFLDKNEEFIKASKKRFEQLQNKVSIDETYNNKYEKPWLNKYDKYGKKTTEDWQKVIKYLASGRYIMKDVESRYKISKITRDEIPKWVEVEKKILYNIK